MKDKTKTEIKDNKCEWPICNGGYKNENGECDKLFGISKAVER